MRSLAQPPVPLPAPQSALAQFAAPLPALCHVTIVGPRKKADLALPADIPLPHVLPGLLRAMGEIGGEAAAAPGWVLQRPGGPPLDVAQSLGALGVLDGEVLYLRPREAAAPPAMFDDVADVVATGVKESAGNWTSSHTRLVGVSSALALLAAGAVTLVFAGPPWTASAVVAGVIALLLVVAGALVSRVVGDSFAGALVGHAALPYGFIAGLLAPAGNGGLTGLGAAHLLAAFATVGLVATVALIAISDGVQGFLGTAIAAMAGAVSSGVVMVSDASPAGVAAVTLTVLLAFSSLIPTVAFRAAGMPMPSMPTNAEELRGDNQRVDGPSVRERTLRAQAYATGMVAGLGMVALGTELYLALVNDWVAMTATVTLALTLLLRSRVFRGFGQRLWLVTAGLAGLVFFALARVAGAGGVAAIIAVMGLMCAAAVAAGMGLWLRQGKPSPFWGRAGDIVEILLIITLFPLALGVLDVYAWVRGLAG